METSSKLPVMKIRLYIGLIVFTLAEIFSGASPLGLLNPFLILVTYPLYLTHFFLFTTIALKYHHTTIRDLYFFGCIYGLYEGFITKVIWFGYGGGDNGFASGSIFGFGIHETLGVVFFWHPVMSFIFPLYISLLLFTQGQDMDTPFEFFRETDNIFHSRSVKRGFLILLLFMLSGNALGPIGIGLGLGSTIVALWLGYRRWVKPYDFTSNDMISIFKLDRRGAMITGSILAVLYIGGYFALVPDKMPNNSQLVITVLMYIILIIMIKTTNYLASSQIHPDLELSPGRIWNIFLEISTIAFLITFLAPLNIILFLVAAISLIPLGFFLLIYFITHSEIGKSNEGQQTIT